MNLVFWLSLYNVSRWEKEREGLESREFAVLERTVRNCSCVPNKDDVVMVAGQHLKVKQVLWCLGDTEEESVVKVQLDDLVPSYKTAPTKYVEGLKKYGWKRKA